MDKTGISGKLMYAGFMVFAASVSISMSAQALGALLVLAGWLWGIAAERKGFFGVGSGETGSRRPRYYDAALLAFLVVLALSTVFSINAGRSLRRFTGFIGEAALYFAVLGFLWDKKRLSLFVRVMVIFAAIESAYGIAQYFTGISFLNYGDAKKMIHPFWRIFGTWDYYNSLGGIAGMIIPVSVFAGIYSDNNRDRYFYFASSLLLVLCLVFTFTRGAWLGVSFSVAALGFAERKKLLAVILLFALALLVYPGTRHRILTSFDLGRESDRLSMWKTAAEVIKRRPVLGSGLETFRDEFYRVPQAGAPEIKEKKYFHYHNIYLGLGAETGLAGLALFLVFTAGVVISGLNKLKYITDRFSKGLLLGFMGTVLCFAVHGMMDYNLRGNTVYLFWLACGIIVFISTNKFSVDS